MKRLFLLDGLSLLYRAHFAFVNAPLVNSRGMETSGLFGFTQMVYTILDREKPDALAVAFDKGRETHRHALYADYKGTRPPTPPALQAQIPYARAILEAMHVPLLEAELWEADDIMGTLARRFSEEGEQVTLVSGDRDVLQLVSDRVTVILTRKGLSETIVYTPRKIQDELGLAPAQLVDLKALAGDSSDNIPGVPGVGPKTAQKLIAQHGSLAELYAHLDAIKGALKDKLVTHKDQAFLCQKLGAIRLDAPIPAAMDELLVRPPDGPKLFALFSELELRRFLDRAPVETVPVAPATVTDTPETLEALAHRLAAARSVAVVPVTTSQRAMECALVGLALSTQEGECDYVPLAHEGLFRMGAPETLSCLAPALAGKPIVAQDTKFVRLVLGRRGVAVGDATFDLSLASYVIDPTRRSHAIVDLAADVLSLKVSPVASVIPKGKDIRQVAPEEMAKVIALHMAGLWRLRSSLEPRLAEGSLQGVYRDLELPLARVLGAMEEAGVLVDADHLSRLSREVAAQVAHLQEQIFLLAGEPFNLASPQQLGRILFEKLGLPVLRKTEKGKAPSTDQDVLLSLEHEHGIEIAKLINQHRHLSKLLSTYIDVLPELILPATGRVHTTFHQAVAATGRLSSADPNLQNIPIRTELGERIRRAFKAAPGHVLVGGDLSQIELRILAHLAGEGPFSRAFRDGVDVHARTAALVFQVPPGQVTGEMRSQAKAINFGIVYGMSSFGLAQQLGIGREAAARFIDDYFAKMPEVRAWLDATLAAARRDGQVATLMGRRRVIPDLSSGDPRRRAAAERMATNTPVQGTAADLIKKAMIDIHARLVTEGWKSRMILSIHDELVFEAPEDEAARLAQMVKEVMEGALTLSVPIVANVRSGATWADLK